MFRNARTHFIKSTSCNSKEYCSTRLKGPMSILHAGALEKLYSVLLCVSAQTSQLWTLPWHLGMTPCSSEG